MKRTFMWGAAFIALMTGMHSVASTPIFVDGFALSVGRDIFMKRFPTAEPLFQRDQPSREMLLVPHPKQLTFGGQPLVSVGRVFVGNTSCAAGTGFGPMRAGDAKALLAILKKRHEKLVAEMAIDAGERVLSYMADSDAKVLITLNKKLDDGEKYTIYYAVVLNSCPPVVAREYQVVPPQK